VYISIYSWLCGYSSNGGPPGPRFELQMRRVPNDFDGEEGIYIYMYMCVWVCIDVMNKYICIYI